MTSTFNAAAWLAGFTDVGGAYGTDGSRLVLAIIPGLRTDEELSQARLLATTLTETQRGEVVRHLSLPVMVEG